MRAFTQYLDHVLGIGEHVDRGDRRIVAVAAPRDHIEREPIAQRLLLAERGGAVAETAVDEHDSLGTRTPALYGIFHRVAPQMAL
jgi:hypothetical protein